jgi:hypothetical protein
MWVGGTYCVTCLALCGVQTGADPQQQQHPWHNKLEKEGFQMLQGLTASSDLCYWKEHGSGSEDITPNCWWSQYPHVAAVYWALYRLGRVGSPPLTQRASWDW